MNKTENTMVLFPLIFIEDSKSDQISPHSDGNVEELCLRLLEWLAGIVHSEIFIQI